MLRVSAMIALFVLPTVSSAGQERGRGPLLQTARELWRTYTNRPSEAYNRARSVLKNENGVYLDGRLTRWIFSRRAGTVRKKDLRAAYLNLKSHIAKALQKGPDQRVSLQRVKLNAIPTLALMEGVAEVAGDRVIAEGKPLNRLVEEIKLEIGRFKHETGASPSDFRQAQHLDGLDWLLIKVGNKPPPKKRRMMPLRDMFRFALAQWRAAH